MLNGALRLAVAAGVAIAVGLVVRAQLLAFFPAVHLTAILIRVTVLCAVGISTYVAFARILGVRELIEMELMLLRKLKFRPSLEEDGKRVCCRANASPIDLRQALVSCILYIFE